MKSQLRLVAVSASITALLRRRHRGPRVAGPHHMTVAKAVGKVLAEGTVASLARPDRNRPAPGEATASGRRKVRQDVFGAPVAQLDRASDF
jgi:hypothetical protein